MVRQRSRGSCANCRDRHLKCVWNSDSCDNCIKTETPCERTPAYVFKKCKGSGDKIHRKHGRRLRLSSGGPEGTQQAWVHSSPNIYPSGATTYAASDASQQTGSSSLSRDAASASQAGSIPKTSPILQIHAGSDKAVQTPIATSGATFDPGKDIGEDGNVQTCHSDIASTRAASLPTALTPGWGNALESMSDLGSIDCDDYYSGTNLFQDSPAIIGLPLGAAISSDYGLLDMLDYGRDISPSSLQGGNTAYHQFERMDLPICTAQDNLNDNLEKTPPLEATRISDRIPKQPEPTPPFLNRDAHLVKFFMQTWGPLLDCNDPDRHFALTVPQLALEKAPCVLLAILTIAALQLSRVSNYPISAARRYRLECGRSLVPVLENLGNPEMDGAIFTTYVLLRIYDQMTALKACPVDQLFASSLALSTAPWHAYADVQGALKRAAFWVHVREDIHVALLLQCPIKIDHVLFEQNIAAVHEIAQTDLFSRQTQPAIGDDTSPKPPVECAWSNQIIGLTCYVVNYCFGPDEEKTVDSWTRLLSRVERWNLEKPANFSPFHEQTPTAGRRNVFPKIWFKCDWHVMGALYYHLSLILLKSTRPYQKKGAEILQNRGELVHHTRMLCGIVSANPIAQALIVACHMLSVAAKYLVCEEEQAEVLQLLRTIRTTTGWPVAEVEEKLRRAWKDR